MGCNKLVVLTKRDLLAIQLLSAQKKTSLSPKQTYLQPSFFTRCPLVMGEWGWRWLLCFIGVARPISSSRNRSRRLFANLPCNSCLPGPMGNLYF